MALASRARVAAPAAPATRSAALPFRPLASVRRAPLRVAAAKQDAAAFEIGKMATLSAVASSWMFSGKAQAAVELAQTAAGDNRLSTISLLFLPAVGWVLFNIAQPALNQLARQNEIKDEAKGSTGKGGKKKRGVAGAVGLGAALSLLAAQQADAATEVAQLAADNRFGTISLLFLPALGWVAFNMAQPALNQLARQSEIKDAASSAVPARRR